MHAIILTLITSYLNVSMTMQIYITFQDAKYTLDIEVDSTINDIRQEFELQVNGTLGFIPKGYVLTFAGSELSSDLNEPLSEQGISAESVIDAEYQNWRVQLSGLIDVIGLDIVKYVVDKLSVYKGQFKFAPIYCIKRPVVIIKNDQEQWEYRCGRKATKYRNGNHPDSSVDIQPVWAQSNN